jgi:hypothetical protein
VLTHLKIPHFNGEVYITAYKILVRKHDSNNHLEDVEIDGEIILKLNIKIYGLRI